MNGVGDAVDRPDMIGGAHPHPVLRGFDVAVRLVPEAVRPKSLSGSASRSCSSPPAGPTTRRATLSSRPSSLPTSEPRKSSSGASKSSSSSPRSPEPTDSARPWRAGRETRPPATSWSTGATDYHPVVDGWLAQVFASRSRHYADPAAVDSFPDRVRGHAALPAALARGALAADGELQFAGRLDQADLEATGARAAWLAASSRPSNWRKRATKCWPPGWR